MKFSPNYPQLGYEFNVTGVLHSEPILTLQQRVAWTVTIVMF
jgi:hypothetical protein